MSEFWEASKTHPITGFRYYAEKDMKIYNKKNYVSQKKYTTEVELGVDMKSGKYRAVFLFGDKSNKRIVIKVCESLEEARQAYQDYFKIVPTIKGIYFSKHKYKWFAKYEKELIWSTFKESEESFNERLPSLIKNFDNAKKKNK